MSKYLELFKGSFNDSINEKTKLENKPYIGYSLIDGVIYTVVPKSVTGPADNEIWYTTVDDTTVTPQYLSNFGAGFVENVYEDGKGVLRFNGPVTHIPGNSNSRIGVSDLDGAFYDCTSLTSVAIPNSVTSIGDRAFSHCYSLTSIAFEGTIEKWNSITKGSYWNYSIPATYVQCTDGQVAL